VLLIHSDKQKDDNLKAIKKKECECRIDYGRKQGKRRGRDGHEIVIVIMMMVTNAAITNIIKREN
jgi:hypothetical protein